MNKSFKYFVDLINIFFLLSPLSNYDFFVSSAEQTYLHVNFLSKTT